MTMRWPSWILLALGLSRASSQGTVLSNGIVTRTDVEMWADLPLDVADIQNRLDSGDSSALDVYVNGRNAVSASGEKLSLSKLIDELAASVEKGTSGPNFLYHLYGLADRTTDTTKLANQAKYADSYVRTAISSKYNVAEAILVLNVWMYATHLLYKGIDTCHKLTLADNPAAFDLGGGGMDEFIALWVGNAQEGLSLYTMTQLAAKPFGTANPDAAVNMELSALYQEGSAILSFPTACTKDDDKTVPQLWTVVQRMISQMTVPLMQLLIDAVFSENPAQVKLYALAVVPQTAQCRPSVYKRLKEELLGTSVDFNRKNEIILGLEEVYDCLGFTCADIGTYKQDQIPQCEGKAASYPLAEYVPTSQVNLHAMIDLDILQVRILTSLGAFSFAKYLYLYGRNSALPVDSPLDPYKLRSLHQMATTTDREAAVPFYAEFVEYHDDTVYAATAVIEALEGKGKWGSSSTESRTEVVALTCACQIVYMYALAEMADAIADCKSQNPLDNVGGSHSWDEVAAFLIGSLEGPFAGGSPDIDDGQLLWNLANKRAFQFQTQNSEGYSRTNSELEDLLFSGRGQLDAFDCGNLEKTVSRIQHWLLIPVIQSTLRFAVENSKLSESSSNQSVAEGETFALSVLPIIKSYDEVAASVIEENMIMKSGVKPVLDGPQAVANAFYEALDEFGISCEYVGASSQVDACSKQGGAKESFSMPSGSIRLHTSAYQYILGAIMIAGSLIS